jgi:REP element-mobilizing transposase RayT
MAYNPKIHNRQSIRLKECNYLTGLYFVTICVQNREHLLGEVVNGKMELSISGRIVKNTWENLPKHFKDVKLYDYIIMPDHIHGIICIGEPFGKIISNGFEDEDNEEIEENLRTPPKGTSSGSLNSIIQNFKSVSTRLINQKNKTSGVKFWQRNYHERIIKNEDAFDKIRNYIIQNPSKWKK